MQDIDMVQIGRRIKELRLFKNWTQTVLAQKLGVAQNTLSQYEKGTAKTSIDIIVKLAHELETTTDYLLCGDQ